MLFSSECNIIMERYYVCHCTRNIRPKNISEALEKCFLVNCTVDLIFGPVNCLASNTEIFTPTLA